MRRFGTPALLLVLAVAACVPSLDRPSPGDEPASPLAADAGHALGAEAGAGALADLHPPQARRLPAEWEPHAATWLQWPGPYELENRASFARIIAVVAKYEPVRILVDDAAMRSSAEQFLKGAGVSLSGIEWRIVPHDNGWMRDNGPIYVRQAGSLRIADFRFDAWGGHFGSEVTHALDDQVPAKLAGLLGLALESHGDYVLERGNLEGNGSDTVVLSWDCQADRNPTWSQAASEALLRQSLGVSRVIWAHGHDPADDTIGHIDGIVRFVGERTVAVARSLVANDPYAATMEKVAAELASAGFKVVRIDSPGDVSYKGKPLRASYMNWLVGNGFVAAMAFGNAAWDQAAKASLEALFPGRTVHLIEANELWANGGGVHCVTNDQPGP